MNLDEDSLNLLYAQYPCRELQIRALLTLLEKAFPSPSSVVVHGLEATGKSSIVKAIIEKAGVPSAIVDSRECITSRQLLERIISQCLDALADSGAELQQLPRCDSISALHVHLESNLRAQEKFILVFDGIDKQRDASPTLLPALARLGECIPNLTIVFIISVPSPRLFHRPGIPHIHFPPYTKDQTIEILSLSSPPIFLTPIDPNIDYTDEEHEEDSKWVWSRFCGVVWDSIGKGAARDLVSFRNACQKLWRPFVRPVVDGTFGTRDFSKLLVNRRALFQGEEALGNGIVTKASGTDMGGLKVNYKLPYYTKFVLCAAYLASFNPPRQDQIYFMKSSERKKRRRNNQTAPGRAQKHRKIPRSLLAPSPFPLDRLLAILHALLPHPMAQTGDVFTQIATLSSVRLLLKAGTTGGDALDPGCKWRVNCGWEYVATLGRSVGLEMRDWIGGQD